MDDYEQSTDQLYLTCWTKEDASRVEKIAEKCIDNDRNLRPTTAEVHTSTCASINIFYFTFLGVTNTVIFVFICIQTPNFNKINVLFQWNKS